MNDMIAKMDLGMLTYDATWMGACLGRITWRGVELDAGRAESGGF